MHGAIVSPAPALNALMDHGWRSFNHWPVISGIWPKGQRSAGYVDKAMGPVRYVSTPVGANKIFEVCEHHLIYPDMTVGWGLRPILFKMIMNAANANPAPLGECFQGIQIGSFGQPPPWQTNYTVAVSPCMQLRYNFALERWEVCVWDWDGENPPDVVACDLQPGFAVDFGVTECVMQFLPNPSGGSVLNCYLNGELAHSYSGPRLETLVTSANAEPFGCGYFLTNGSSASAYWSEGGFYGGRVHEPYSP